jgi:YegS/Rv2252/BmrU family lipid kinase
MKRGILVYNPTAGQRDLRGAMSTLIDRMRGRGLELVNAPTSGPGDATRIVRAFLSRGIDLIAVCGGDGTVSEVAAGLDGSTVPLGLLPSGTSNVLALELGIPLELPRAEELLLAGVPTALRLAHAGERPFLLWTGAGLDARVMDRMSLTLKRRLGRWGITPTAYAEFFRYEFPRMEVEIDGVRQEATYVVVSRVSRYAGDWIITPESRPDSETLDVLLFAHRDLWKLFRLFQEMKRGRGGHLSNGLARVVRGREVTIRSLESYPVDIQVDGDCVLETPIRCRVGTEMVHILVPSVPAGS